MESLVLETETLPKALAGRIRAQRVRVADFEDGVTLLPVEDKQEYHCNFRGILKDEYFSIDAFLERKRADKELEQ